jgi:hypothetical protein
MPNVLVDLAALICAVTLATTVSFLLARQRVGNMAALVGLVIGNLLGGTAGFLYLACPILGRGHTWLDVLHPLTGTDRNWIAIAAILGMFLSFLSIVYIGPLFLQRRDQALPLPTDCAKQNREPASAD